MKSEKISKLQKIVGAGTVAAVAAVAGYTLRDASAQSTTAKPDVAPVATTATAPPASSAPPVVKSPAVQSAAAMQNAFSEVARVAEPAVVTITTSERQQRNASNRFLFNRPGQGRGNGNGNGSDQDSFDEFMRRFRDFGLEPNSYKGDLATDSKNGFHLIQAPETPRSGSSGQLVETGLGSGVIYDKSGLILTNAHVVSGADRVSVKLLDGREFKDAKVLGIDERTDIAVVKIPLADAPAVTLGDSSKVDVGDWAIAVGNPFGLSNTLTVGVISATAREVPLSAGTSNDYLQTDASINRGNSGGPLLDIYGRVIGINNAIYSQSGGSVGIGFAIPINVAKQVADSLVRDGRVRRALIGVKMSNVTTENAAAFGLPTNTKGVLVQQVVKDFPAASAGVQVGDVITGWNGETVGRDVDLQRKVTASPIGKAGVLTVQRDGKPLTLNVTPIEMQDESANPTRRTTPAEPAPEKAEPIQDNLGMRLLPLNDATRTQFKIPSSIKNGVLVAEVQDGSPADRAGLQEGDIIQRVGQTTVNTPSDVTSAKDSLLKAQTSENKSVALYVIKGGEGGYIVVPVGE